MDTVNINGNHVDGNRPLSRTLECSWTGRQNKTRTNWNAHHLMSYTSAVFRCAWKKSYIYFKGWRMVHVNARRRDKRCFLRAHFDFLDCETDISKCFKCEREKFRLLGLSSDCSRSTAWKQLIQTPCLSWTKFRIYWCRVTIQTPRGNAIPVKYIYKIYELCLARKSPTFESLPCQSRVAWQSLSNFN